MDKATVTNELCTSDHQYSNALVVEHKYKNSLSIKVMKNYKKKEQQNPKGTHKNSSKNNSKSISLQKPFFSF